VDVFRHRRRVDVARASDVSGERLGPQEKYRMTRGGFALSIVSIVSVAVAVDGVVGAHELELRWTREAPGSASEGREARRRIEEDEGTR